MLKMLNKLITLGKPEFLLMIACTILTLWAPCDDILHCTCNLLVDICPNCPEISPITETSIVSDPVTNQPQATDGMQTHLENR